MTEDVYLGQRRCWFCESKQAMYWQEEAKEITCRKCGLWQMAAGGELTAHEQKWLTFIGEEYENRTGISLIKRRTEGAAYVERVQRHAEAIQLARSFLEGTRPIRGTVSAQPVSRRQGGAPEISRVPGRP